MHARFRITLFLLVVLCGSVAHARHDYDDDSDDRYVFAATRSVNRTDAPVLLKATLLPLTVIVDILFLPIAALADAVN